MVNVVRGRLGLQRLRGGCTEHLEGGFGGEQQSWDTEGPDRRQSPEKLPEGEGVLAAEGSQDLRRAHAPCHLGEPGISAGGFLRKVSSSPTN